MKSSVRTLSIGLCTFWLTAGVAIAPAFAASKGAVAARANVEQERLGMDRQRLLLDESKAKQQQAEAAARLDLDREKMKLEQAKLELEKSRSVLTTAGSFIPLVAAILTVAFGVWSLGRQAKTQSEAQLSAAQLAFEIKAAEIAFAADKSPYAVLNRGRALKAMFSDRLPNSFLEGLEPTDFGGKKEPSEEKKYLMGLLAAHVGDAKKIVGLWEQLFPGDHEWLGRVSTYLDDQDKVSGTDLPVNP